MIIGIASSRHELNEAPGFANDSVGFNSFTGKLHSNRKDVGNMRGHRCKRGDTMGIEVEVFDNEMSVVLFSKNFRPIGTRYLTLRDHYQYFPTILIENGGDPVDLLVYWQTRVSVPQHYSVVKSTITCPFLFLFQCSFCVFFVPEKSGRLVRPRRNKNRFERKNIHLTATYRSFVVSSSAL